MSEYEVIQIHAGGFDDNFSYLVRSSANGDAAVIDPCGDISKLKAAFRNFEPSGLVPKYILITHSHHDHTTGLSEVKGSFFNAPSAAYFNSGLKTEIRLKDRQKLPFGTSFIECISTPGHSDDSVCYRLGDDSAIFTGDTLFIDFCGYCDARKMFATMRNIMITLPDSLEVYSGHNYGHAPHEPLGIQKKTNPYLAAGDFGKFEKELQNL